MKSRIVCLVVCAAIALTGCDGSSRTGGSGNSDSLGIGHELDRAATYVMIGAVVVGVATYGLIHERQRHQRDMRPSVTLSAPERVSPNDTVPVEAVYRDKGKVVTGWWEVNPYTVVIHRKGDNAEVKPASIERRGDGTLLVTFQPAEPGTWIIEARTWASSADQAAEKPRAAAHRTVKVG